MFVTGETVGTDVDIVAVVDVTIREHIPRTVFVVRVRRSSPVGMRDTDAAVDVVADATIRPYVPRKDADVRDRRDNAPVGKVATVVATVVDVTRRVDKIRGDGVVRVRRFFRP